MPDPSDIGAGPAPHGAGPALAALVGPDITGFARDHWGRAPSLRRAAELPGGAAALNLADIDELLSERALRTPFIRVTNDGVVTPPSAYTAAAGAGAGVTDQVRDTAVARLLADGETVVLQGLHRSHLGVRRLVTAMATELGCPVQANAYVTPAERQGFDPHYDVHDVFVVQLAGSKHWRVHEPVHRHPLADQPWTQRRAAVEERAAAEPLLDVVLQPGDVLYLPRGTVHGARSIDGLSAHLTLGVHPLTLHHLARAALAELAEDDELRASLPLGTRLEDAVGTELARKGIVRILTALDALDPERIASTAAAQVVTATRPHPLGPLAHARLLATLDAHTLVARRAGLFAVVAEDHLQLPEEAVALTVEERGAARHVLDGATHAAGALPGLDPAASVELVRRLARAGALVAAGA